MISNANGVGNGEGYGGDLVGIFVSRVKNLGGTIDYVDMDEPLWFGHISTTRNALATDLNLPIPVLAKNIAAQVATIHQYFPNAQIGDTEPVSGIVEPVDYVSQVMQFAAAYQSAVGSPLAFWHADSSKSTVNALPLQELSTQLRAQGIRFGIIYDGTPSDLTGLQWTTDAEQYFAGIETNPSMVPDDAVIMSWQAQPLYALPETTPGTMTYLVDRYVAGETSFKLIGQIQVLTGSLFLRRMKIIYLSAGHRWLQPR